MQDSDAEVFEVLEDIKFGVKASSLSSLNQDFPKTKGTIISVTTLENEEIQVLMNIRGFKIFSKDMNMENDEGYSETLNGLLMNYSPKFKQAFHDTLFSKLQKLQQQQDE